MDAQAQSDQNSFHFLRNINGEVINRFPGLHVLGLLRHPCTGPAQPKFIWRVFYGLPYTINVFRLHNTSPKQFDFNITMLLCLGYPFLSCFQPLSGRLHQPSRHPQRHPPAAFLLSLLARVTISPGSRHY